MDKDTETELKEVVNRLFAVENYVVREDKHPKDTQMKIRKARNRLEDILEQKD